MKAWTAGFDEMDNNEETTDSTLAKTRALNLLLSLVTNTSVILVLGVFGVGARTIGNSIRVLAGFETLCLLDPFIVLWMLKPRKREGVEVKFVEPILPYYPSGCICICIYTSSNTNWLTFRLNSDAAFDAALKSAESRKISSSM